MTMARALFALLTAVQGPWLSHARTLLSLHANGLHDVGNTATPLTLDNAVVRRGSEEVAIASTASKQALVSAKDAFTARQNLISEQASSGTKASYLKVKPLLPEARAQLLTVRKFAAEAKMHAEHALKVLAGSKHIANAAAEKALEATKGWVASDAAASAEASSKADNRRGRLAGAVAGAAEPYHLALLRNQKFCEQTYAKAKSAHGSAVKLIDDSNKVALQAQAMQASGMGIEAQQTLSMAKGMITEAETLRQWGLKLYGQANTACGTAAGYETLEQQAAANAAATTIMNAPMKLPLEKK